MGKKRWAEPASADRPRPDRAQPGSCPECGGENGGHQQVAYSESVYDRGLRQVRGYNTRWKRCPRA